MATTEVVSRLEMSLQSQTLDDIVGCDRVLIFSGDRADLTDKTLSYFNRGILYFDATDMYFGERSINLARPRNIALRLAREGNYDWLSFCDSDTILLRIGDLDPCFPYNTPQVYWQKEEESIDEAIFLAASGECEFSLGNSWFVIYKTLFDIEFNEYISGYGFEDIEYDVHIRSLGYEMRRTNGVVVHKFHSQAERRVSPQRFEYNKTLCHAYSGLYALNAQASWRVTDLRPGLLFSSDQLAAQGTLHSCAEGVLDTDVQPRGFMMLRDRIFDTSPYAGFNPKAFAHDPQGWCSDHRYLTYAIERARPKSIVEVGSWKGASAITMGNKVRDLGLQCEIVCVDTWLGSPEHWLRGYLPGTADWYDSLLLKHGYPSFYNTFLTNILTENLQDFITPFPATSENAAVMLTHLEARFDIAYIDAAHEYEPVLRDLRAFWPLLRNPGIMIGDDYHWSGVRQAANEFAIEVGETLLEEDGKFMIGKGNWSPML